jgi:hypothetical protein
MKSLIYLLILTAIFLTGCEGVIPQHKSDNTVANINKINNNLYRVDGSNTFAMSLAIQDGENKAYNYCNRFNKEVTFQSLDESPGFWMQNAYITFHCLDSNSNNLETSKLRGADNEYNKSRAKKNQARIKSQEAALARAGKVDTFLDILNKNKAKKTTCYSYGNTVSCETR